MKFHTVSAQTTNQPNNQLTKVLYVPLVPNYYYYYPSTLYIQHQAMRLNSLKISIIRYLCVYYQRLLLKLLRILPTYLSTYTLWPIRLNNKSFAFHMPSSPQNLALRALMTHVFMARRKALNPSRQPPFCRRRCQQPYTHPKNSKQ